MTTALVAISFSQLAVLSVLAHRLKQVNEWAASEQASAIQYREAAREHLGSIDDATLAAWARLAGKQRLEQARDRNGAVLASRRDQHEQASQPGRCEAIEEVLHPSIVLNGADR